MKKFTDFHNKINEAAVCTTADKNPGNNLNSTGLMNHRTPIQNILIGVNNLFASHQGVVASIGEDGVSIKLNCTRFRDIKSINNILYNYGIYRDTCLASYIINSGLPIIKCVNIGQYYIVYFEPDDIKIADIDNTDTTPADVPDVPETPVEEMKLYGIAEAEMFSLNQINENDEELEDADHEKIIKLADDKDKVKAAKQIEQIVLNNIDDLPHEYYFAGVKSTDGKESVALRWRSTLKRPGGDTATITYTLFNIFGSGKNGIWVPSFAEDSIVKFPDEVNDIIHQILNDILEAHSTDDPSVYVLDEDTHNRSTSKKSKKDDDDNDVDDSDDDNDSDKDSEINDDTSDDNSDENNDSTEGADTSDDGSLL